MTREEAIKEIKSWAIPSEKGREVLEILIPELAESEDERIRKGLISYFEIMAGNYFGEFKKSDIIAYLEKQKELDKMIVVSPEVWDTAIADAYENGKKDGEKQKEPHYTKRNALFDKCVENCDPNVMKSVSNDVDEMLKKEQNPVEIDEEINRWMGCEAFPEGTNITPLPQAMEIVERTAKHFFELGEKTVPSPGGYWEGFNHGVRECQARIRDVNDTMKEQKPAEHSAKGRRGRIGSTPEHIRKKAENFLSKMEPPYDADDICSAYETGAMESTKLEWSEEDEKMLRTIISDGSRGVELDSKQISWLKSLRPQPKQEWSDEETKDLVHILKVLDDCYAYGNHNLSKTDHDNLTSTIKSLRPSWKPSEEQMEALKCAIADVARFSKRGGRQVELANESYYSALHSLYEQLKNS